VVSVVDTNTDRALSRIFRRQWCYLVGYLTALTHSQKVRRFRPILEAAFNHPWVVGAEIKIRFWKGGETNAGRLWRLYKGLPAQSMTWDAPITVTIFRGHRGKKRQALCMSFYIVRDALYIAQMQGIWKTDVPNDLRPWPRIFIRACQIFARHEKLRAVMVPKAAALYSYRNPFIRADLLPVARQNALNRIRKSMTTLYDANAIALGFSAEGDWFKWDA
jgi:hypothetical protein